LRQNLAFCGSFWSRSEGKAGNIFFVNKKKLPAPFGLAGCIAAGSEGKS
jgi:hypothetical protein